tara:strand:- start:248 stop:1675 length:1428 start_codon:yes stop_codon:yes gene_type:complete
MKIIPVILSGGSGSRLWPLSRKNFPKQFQSLATDNSIFQETLLRLNGLEGIVDPIIICNKEHRFFVAEQLQQIGVKNATILLEPLARNTAPAIAAAAVYVMKANHDKNASLLVLPSDHIIQDIKSFHDAINIAVGQSSKNKLVTFGIPPKNPNTEYGYIKIDDSDNEKKAYNVLAFTEKPEQKTAKSYVSQGNYFWNSGMFVFKPETLISELSIYANDIVLNAKSSVDNAQQDLDFVCLDAQFFKSCPNNSIDYALLENSSNVVSVPLMADWSDIGSWSAIYDLSQKDNDDNVFLGDAYSVDTTNTYIQAKHHLVATIGVKDLIIIDTPDATLIAKKSESQKVKKIVERLQHEDRQEQIFHRKVYRPWGWYDCIEKSKYFQVKRLRLNPGAKLSLQLHNKRSEHWVVVSGVGIATNGEEKITLTEGMSTLIPLGTKHSLENTTDKKLEIIEVQSGTYLGEDDIVRFEDIYGRIKD